MKKLYFAVSDYYKELYGEKVVKLPVSLPVTCPNRDGSIGNGGCIYCAPAGAGFESLDSAMSVTEQLERNRGYIGKKYNARKFIAYFQNFCNTYMPSEKLYDILIQAALPEIVEIYVSTRPDCVSRRTAQILKSISEETGRKICVELGLQSVNTSTLRAIHRGHSLVEFIDAVLALHTQNISVITHIIADLPWDSMEDVVECAKILSALRVEGVKIHSLYVPKGSILEKLYTEEKMRLLHEEEYINRVIAFLCHADPAMVIHRLVGRIPKEESVVANFNRSWWVVKERIEETMRASGLYQGITCDYLDGSALRRRGF